MELVTPCRCGWVDAQDDVEGELAGDPRRLFFVNESDAGDNGSKGQASRIYGSQRAGNRIAATQSMMVLEAPVPRGAGDLGIRSPTRAIRSIRPVPAIEAILTRSPRR